MQGQDESQKSAELRQAFLRHLPKRLDGVRRRGRRLGTSGWDVNALLLLFHEVQALAGACGRYALLDLGEHLFALEGLLAIQVERMRPPEPEETARLLQLSDGLSQFIERQGGAATPREMAGAGSASGNVATIEGIPVQIAPPLEFVQRFARDPSTPVLPETTPEPPVAAAAVETAAGAAPAVPARPPGRGEGKRIYHLTDGNHIAVELDQRLERQGYTLELLDQPDELREMLRALTPSLVVVDSRFLEEIEALGETVRAVRQRASQRVSLLVMSDSGDVGTRLRAMRAGADSFIPLPASATDVMARITELLDAETAQPFRVMIIEDDRSQALFAESILKKAGMQTCAVMDPLSAMQALDEFRPELILMDLYMPNCDGMELTTLIRERDAFINTPIVFLSGEHDTDKRFDALSAGGDDYLEKPIRPKYLISAVTNRVRRARAMNRRVQAQNPRDPVTGLYDRAHVIDRISEMLASEEPGTNLGGLLFIIIDGAQAIRERIGLSAFDTLLGQAGALLAGTVSSQDLAARYGDTSFLVLAPGRGEQELLRFGEDIRARFEKHVFEVEDKSMTLAVSVGVATFALGWSEAGAILNAAERACALARTSPDRKVRVFEPQVVAPTIDPADALLGEIGDAIKYDKFQLLFQPIASLRGVQEEQFQVLLRLRSDNGRIHTAAALIPAAEGAGLINQVDRWVLARCLSVIQERQRQDDARPVRLFVNQAVDGMLDAQRPAWLKQQLDARRVPGEQLVLAFRFADVLARLRQAGGFCQEVRQIGPRIALTGFEASMASYQMLQHVALDFLVLSPKYVGAEGQDAKTRQELRQLIGYAKERDLKVVAPLVEDAQTAAALWSSGVDFIQGNFVQQATHDMEFDFSASAL